MTPAPILDVINPETGRHQKIWRFANQYGISAVKQADIRGSDGTNWGVAIIKFESPNSFEFELDYDNPLCREKDDIFHNVPDNMVESLVILASKMECPDSN